MNCSNDFKNQSDSWPSVSNFQKFITGTIFLTVDQNNFRNKILRVSTNLLTISNSDPSFFQETLLKQVRITHGLFCILNLISLIVFIALVETHIFSDTHKVWLIMEATNRLIIYLIPIALLIMNTALSGAYTHHVKTLRFRFCEKNLSILSDFLSGEKLMQK